MSKNVFFRRHKVEIKPELGQNQQKTGFCQKGKIHSSCKINKGRRENYSQNKWRRIENSDICN